MPKSRIKGQQFNIEYEINNIYYKNRKNRETNYGNNFEILGEKDEEQRP